jgi:tetratricopeptide (TPR) repeat protein
MMPKQLNLWASKLGVLTAAIILLFFQQVHAEWYKDYEAGMEALKKGQNQAAVGRFQSAISQKSDEGTSIKFYGMKFDDYFPHYYLGTAYFNLKNYDAALAEFQISEQNGAIQKRRDLYVKLGNLRSLVHAQKIVKEPPTIASKPQEPVKTEPEVKEETKPKPEEDKPTEVTKTEPPPVQVTELKTEKKEEKLPVAEETKKSPEEVPKPAPDMKLESAKIFIKNGARKYFEGDFDGAITLLMSAVELNQKDASAYFLLGCSYASKYLLSGSQDKALLQYASDAFVNTRRVNPGYKIRNKTYFSPAVLDLYTKSS